MCWSAQLFGEQAVNVHSLVKEINLELQRGKLHCTLGEWSRWTGSTNLAIVEITDSMQIWN